MKGKEVKQKRKKKSCNENPFVNNKSFILLLLFTCLINFYNSQIYITTVCLLSSSISHMQACAPSNVFFDIHVSST